MSRVIFCAEGNIIEEKLLSEIVAFTTQFCCDFRILEFNVGTKNNRPSFLKIELYGNDPKAIANAAAGLLQLGMHEEERAKALFKPALADSFVPDDFYASGNHQVELFYHGNWLSVDRPKADSVIVKREQSIESILLRHVKKDDLILCGDEAIRVNEISFSSISNERSSIIAATDVAKVLIANRAKHKKTVFLAGSVAIRAGGGGALERLVKAGFVNTFLGNNDLAVYDIESNLFQTILGYSVEDGLRVKNGRRNTLRTINRINGYGSISSAVESGALHRGLMYQLETNSIPYSLAGSISDIGPLADTITDTKLAQETYEYLLRDTETLVMFSSYQTAFAAAKLVPSWVQTFFIDINSNVVTRLIDMAAPQTVGIVSDAGLFLNDLIRILHLDDLPTG